MLSKDDVKHIADLVKLTLAEEEVVRLRSQLSETLEYIDVLNELDTEGVDSTYQVTGLLNILREDEEKNSLSQAEALSGTRSESEGYFKVNPIFEDLNSDDA